MFFKLSRSYLILRTKITLLVFAFLLAIYFRTIKKTIYQQMAYHARSRLKEKSNTLHVIC